MTWWIRATGCALLVLALVAAASMTGAAKPSMRERVIKGKEARAYVAQLRASDKRFRDVMALAEGDLRARGYEPVPEGVVVVERVQEPAVVARILDRLVPGVAAQSVYRSDGRVIWSPWNDGDARTWEGNVFGESYTGRVYAAANFQFSTDTGTWTPLTYWSSQTGTSGPPPPSPTHWHGGRCNGPNITDHALKHAMQNAASTCASAAAVCRITSFAYFNCLAGACVGTIAKGFIDDLLAWSRECRMNCKWTNTSAGVWQCI